MDCISLTFDIKEYFGVKTAHIAYEGNDYIVMLKNLSDSLVVFTCPDIPLKFGQKFKLFFPSKFDKVSLDVEIDNFYFNDIMFVVEGSILNWSNKVFLDEFIKFILELINQKKRKENRILCTQANLALLKMKNTISFDFRFRSFKGIIKDISYSAIRILTDPILLEEKGDLFSFKLYFTEPEEKFIFINCPVIRKEEYVFENTKFAQIVFAIENNIKYSNRLSVFFDDAKKNDIKHIR